MGTLHLTVCVTWIKHDIRNTHVMAQVLQHTHYVKLNRIFLKPLWSSLFVHLCDTKEMGAVLDSITHFPECHGTVQIHV